MIRKASDHDGSWVAQVSYGIMVLWYYGNTIWLPHKNRRLSPFEMIYGKTGRSVLDVSHNAWTSEGEFHFEV